MSRNNSTRGGPGGSSRRSMQSRNSMGGGSSRSSMMGGGRGYAGKGGMGGTQVVEKPPLQILDASGKDVTEILPRSLLDPTVNSREKLLGQEKANSKLQGLLGGKSSMPSALLIGGLNDTTLGGGATADKGMNNPFGDSKSTRGGDRSVGTDNGAAAGGEASQASRSSVQGVVDDYVPPESKLYSGLADVQTIRTRAVEEVPEEELDKRVMITLSETETFHMFQIAGTHVGHDAADFEALKAGNEKYAELLKNREGARDNLSDRWTQTLTLPDKHKECQANAVQKSSTGSEASEANIFDTFRTLEKIEDQINVQNTIGVQAGEAMAPSLAAYKSHPDHPDFNPDLQRTMMFANVEAQTENDVGQLWTGSGPADGGGRADSAHPAPPKEQPTVYIPPSTAANDGSFEAVAAMPTFMDQLRLTERLVVHREYAVAQSVFRGIGYDDEGEEQAAAAGEAEGEAASGDGDGAAVAGGEGEAAAAAAAPDAAAAVEEDAAAAAAVEAEGDDGEADAETNEPGLNTLWTYACSASRGRSVTCTAWNKKTVDILAAGYGDFEFASEKSGLACCWSLKNPEFPERMYKLPCSVTSIDWCESRPNLLAVGTSDGTVVVFDVSLPTDDPIVTSDDQPHHLRHVNTVWVVKWAKFGTQDQKEALAESIISGSSDGRVLKGVMVPNKGVQVTDLMRIKRVLKDTKTAQNSKGQAAFMALRGTCMSLDFWKQDPHVYLLGTEDGSVHKCSTSYSEQFVTNYFGHGGPVYNTEWSPFADDLFMTCSADWTMRIWDHSNEEALKVLKFSSKAILDCAWSPHSSTVMASVSDGGLSIWDLSVKELDPIVVLDTTEAGTKLTTVTFSSKTNAVLYGDSDGRITVAMLKNVSSGTGDVETEKARLLEIVAKDKKKAIGDARDDDDDE